LKLQGKESFLPLRPQQLISLWDMITAAFRHALDGQKLGWAMWDWSAAFRYWDKKNNQPVPGLHEALFEKSTR
jgi:hypothetical protein